MNAVSCTQYTTGKQKRRLSSVEYKLPIPGTQEREQLRGRSPLGSPVKPAANCGK